MLRDFKKEKEMPTEIIEKYKGQVPDEIIEIWKNYGLGSFMNGYMKVINPDDYKKLVEETYFRGNVAIPIFITAFADIITWEEDEYIGMIEYKNLGARILLKGKKRFFNFFKNKNIWNNIFEFNMYEKIFKLYGALNYNDCYCLDFENSINDKIVRDIQKSKTYIYIKEITNIMGKVGMLKDFEKEKEMPKQVIEKYRDLVPNELIDVWEEYGLGSFMNGYVKIINPEEYQELLEESYIYGKTSIPILATAFGDIITWEENKDIGIVFYKDGTFDIICSGMENFFLNLYDEEWTADDIFDLKMYRKAIKKYGKLNYNQCFYYVPLLGLGGVKKVENLQKGDIRIHIQLIMDSIGLVEEIIDDDL